MAAIIANPAASVLNDSCSAVTPSWLRSTDPENGVELLEASLHGPAYHKHRHDTYAICLTTQRHPGLLTIAASVKSAGLVRSWCSTRMRSMMGTQGRTRVSGIASYTSNRH